MPTIGSYTSLPGNRFRVMRSYITHIALKQNTDNYPPTFVDNLITWPSAAFPGIVQYATLYDNFLAWNSNAYTLDTLITAYWYTVSPSPTPIPNAGLILRYKWDVPSNSMILEIEKEAANTEVTVDLTSGGGGYWLDPVPA